MDNALKYAPLMLRYSTMLFCVFGAAGSIFELNTTSLEDRAFAYSPWVFMTWSFSNLAWIFFALKVTRVSVYAAIVSPLVLIIIDIICGVVVASEQGVGTLLPVGLLSLAYLAAGLTGRRE